MISVTTMLLLMQEVDQPQVVISKTVHYAKNYDDYRWLASEVV